MTGHDSGFMLNLSCKSNVTHMAMVAPTVQRFQVVAKTFFTNLLSCLLLNFQVKPWLNKFGMEVRHKDEFQWFKKFVLVFSKLFSFLWFSAFVLIMLFSLPLPFRPKSQHIA